MGCNDMNLNQLKIFYMAAKYGSLSAAAQQLCITQPAVTKGIQRLQEHYELKFFNRFGKKLVLTDAGESLCRIAESIFEMENQAEENLRDYQQRKKGFVRVLSSESFGAYYMPAAVCAFCNSHPHIRLAVDILPTDLIAEQTAALGNDLGFISYPIDHKKLVIREVMEDSYVLIAPPGHSLTRKKAIQPQDLQKHSMIMHERNSAPRRATDEYLRKFDISVSIPLELSNNESMKYAVRQGIGVAIMSRKVASEEIKEGKLAMIPLADPAMKRKFYLIHHKDKYISKSLQSLISTVDSWAIDYMRSANR